MKRLLQRVRTPSAKRLKNRKENGAAVVEAAIVTPLFVMLIMGILEFGPWFYQWGSSKDAVSEGVRLASVMGAAPYSDYEVIHAMRSDLRNIGDGLDYVIIYKSNNLRSGPPAACVTAAELTANRLSPTLTPIGVFDASGVAGGPWTVETYDWNNRVFTSPLIACNIYYRRMINTAVPATKPLWLYDRDNALLPSPILSLDRFWPGPARVDYQSGPQDFVGIYVQSKYKSPVGIVKDRTIRSFGVVRIEPTRANR